jgi:D-xylose transport system permease protein
MTAPDMSKVNPSNSGNDELEARTGFSGDNAGPKSLGGYFQGYVDKVRGGDVGALPAVLGLIVLVIVFTIAKPGADGFPTVYNFANLLQQAGSIIVLAMGLGFVLLLGHIDLSAGVIGGVAAAVMAELLLSHNWSWFPAVLAAIVVGVVMGLLTGWIVTVIGIPSFVVTLAFFLAYQGVLLVIIGDGGTVPVTNQTITNIDSGNMSVTVGWIVSIVSVLLYAGLNLLVWKRRTEKHLVTAPLVVVVLRIVVIAIVLLVGTWALSANRSKGPIPLEGVPWIAPIVGVLLVIWTFVQNRTSFGRYVYAVGGNAEASRRAGIRVGRISIYCFVISSAMAAFSGVIDASRLGSVAPSSGGGNVLLYAVAAAVIGGTSLFGGKGKARDAILGGLVIAVINNGLGLLGLQADVNYIITGIVLLLAASVDALSRRRRAGSAR